MTDNPGMPPLPARLSARFVRPSVVCATLLLAACSSLLPDTSSRTQTGWVDYDDARVSIERIVPYETHKSTLDAAGLEPRSNPAITILTYSDILQRFAVGSVVRSEDLDRGIRECLTAGKRCHGYSIVARRTKRDRIGNFWLDSLGFRREVDVTGWSFNALILFIDDLVVYTVHGGQPNIRERELTRNPLGPLQSWGEQVPTIIR